MCHQYNNENWGHVNSNRFSKKEGDDGYEVLAAKPRGQFSDPRVMNRRMSVNLVMEINKGIGLM